MKRSAPASLESELWAAGELLRGQMDAAEYKQVVLGLVFLRSADPARWSALQQQTGGPAIGAQIDAAMQAIERERPQLVGILPAGYARPALDQDRLGELVRLLDRIDLGASGDALGRVYEYFLGRFASSEGKRGGEFYTPPSVVRLLVELLEPRRGSLYDPTCGSGGMFVEAARWAGCAGDLSCYGQEFNSATWRLARMNLVLRGLAHDLGTGPADTLRADQHPGLLADYILANPPFNLGGWGAAQMSSDPRWRFGPPPDSNANYAWLQHCLYHLAPGGRAAVVLANGSMSSNQSGEGEIRRRMVEADPVECMVALPGQLFYNTQIPACLWLLARDKHPARRGQVLFIDARRLGVLEDRTHRVLPEAEIAQIAATYHAWRGAGLATYADVPGFCKSATLAEIESHGCVLTPGRYVGAAEAEQPDEPFEQTYARLTAELEQQFAEGRRLEEVIREGLKGLVKP